NWTGGGCPNRKLQLGVLGPPLQTANSFWGLRQTWKTSNPLWRSVLSSKPLLQGPVFHPDIILVAVEDAVIAPRHWIRMARKAPPNDWIRLLACLVVALPVGIRLAPANHFADVRSVGRAESFNAEGGRILGVLRVQGA